MTEAPLTDETRNRIFQRLQFLQSLEQRLQLNLISVRSSMKELADLLRKDYYPNQPDPILREVEKAEPPKEEEKKE